MGEEIIERITNHYKSQASLRNMFENDSIISRRVAAFERARGSSSFGMFVRQAVGEEGLTDAQAIMLLAMRGRPGRPLSIDELVAAVSSDNDITLDPKEVSNLSVHFRIMMLCFKLEAPEGFERYFRVEGSSAEGYKFAMLGESQRSAKVLGRASYST